MHSKIKRSVSFKKSVTRVFLFYLLYAHAWYLWLWSKEKNLKKEIKRKRKSKRNQNTFTWLQACFKWCNSLGDSHFKTNEIDDVENLFDYYLHITFSILCTLTSCTHYMQIFAKSSTWDCVLSNSTIFNCIWTNV